MKTAHEVYVGRQPILDRSMRVLGYELLFRHGADATSATASGDRATSRVIVNAFAEFGLSRLVGDKLAFVNMTRPFLIGTLPVPFRPDEVVLEVVEDVGVDDDLVAGVARMSEAGFAVAVEANAERLLPFATYAKIDVLERSVTELEVAVKAVRSAPSTASRHLRLVAERVESRAVMAQCRDLGFDYFQGYLLARPSVVTNRALSPSTVTCMELLNQLTDPAITFEDLDRIVRLDVSLSFRVLRAVNSVASGIVRPISSVREALVLLGLKQLRSWVLLMVLADATDVENEQLANALTRARMCELVSPLFPAVAADSAFLVGLLSNLEVLLGTPMTEVVERLPLEPTVTAALLYREGPLGAVLDSVTAYEDGDLEAISASALELSDLTPAYLEAIEWSMRTVTGALAV